MNSSEGDCFEGFKMLLVKYKKNVRKFLNDKEKHRMIKAL